MPQLPKIKKKAYLYPDGPGFKCDSCGEYISGSEERVWFPQALHKPMCETCGREACAQEEIEVVLKQ